MQANPSSLQRLLRYALIAAGAGAVFTLSGVQAQTPAPAAPPAAATTSSAPQLTIRDVYDRVEAAGYRDIREIEYSKGRYEVEARNAQGARVKLYVNASTGVVEHTRTRN